MRFLFITSHPPLPAGEGGAAQRSSLILEALNRRGKVEVLVVGPLSDEKMARLRYVCTVAGHIGDESKYRETSSRLLEIKPSKLLGHVSALLYSRWQYTPSDRLRTEAARNVNWERYDLIVGRYLMPTSLSGALDQDLSPVIVDIDDLDWKKSRLERSLRKRSPVERCIDALRIASEKKAFNRHICRSSGALVANPNDLEEVPCSWKGVLPNIPFREDVSKESRSPEAHACQGRTVLFVGHMGYGPNLEGLMHFVDCIWPRISGEVTGAILRVAGCGATDNLKIQLAKKEGVDFAGQVDDIRGEYSRCAFSVVPVYWGGGTKIKVLESLRWARLPVVSLHSFSGYEGVLKHGESIWVAATDDDFAEECIYLLKNPGEAARMAATGSELVRKKFNKAVFRDALLTTVDRALHRSACR